jgi:hypothetical protein
MVLLTAAVGATGTALGLVTIGHFTGRSGEKRGAEVTVSRDACAKTLGMATCLAAGSWMKAFRHVALIGEVLVISRRPGSADTSLQLRGAHVAADGYTVKVTALSGAALATFWLNSPAEAARWAKELDSSATSLPKMSSLSKMSSMNRRKRHMDEISAEQALWEAKIRMVQDSARQQDTLCMFHNMVLDEVTEKEQEMTKLGSDTTKLSSYSSESSSQSGSLDSHQIDKLEQISNDRRAVSISSSKESRTAVPQLELGPLQQEQARPAVQSQRVGEPTAWQDDMMGSLRSGMAHLQELPKILTVGRAEVEEMKVASTRIAELERRLARSTQEMLQGPAGGKEMVTKPFGAIPEGQGMLGPWSPRGCLYTPRGYPSSPAAALDF